MVICPGCNREFEKSSSLNSHKRFCSKWTKSIPLKRKTREENLSIPSACPSCDKVFKNVYAMSAHKGHCMGNSTIDHLKTSRGWSKGKLLKKEKEIFKEHSEVSSGYTKQALLKFKHKEFKCEICHLKSWQDKQITLELDHINGIRNDNRLENLRLLCPNCHSQTETWKGKNINTGRKKVKDEILIKALQNSKNIRQALMSVGLGAGKNYIRCYKLIVQHNIEHLL